MTDKQIIIDGINVVDCNYIIDHDPPREQGTWGSAIHKGACKIYSKDCKHNPDCYFKQECKELKKEIAFGNNGTLSDKIRAEVFKELNDENNQLKAENETWQKEYWKLEQGNDFLAEKTSKLKGCLTEIKEILGIHKDNKCAICPKFDECFEHPSCDNIILQKISECEVENE